MGLVQKVGVGLTFGAGIARLFARSGGDARTFNGVQLYKSLSNVVNVVGRGGTTYITAPKVVTFENRIGFGRYLYEANG